MIVIYTKRKKMGKEKNSEFMRRMQHHITAIRHLGLVVILNMLMVANKLEDKAYYRKVHRI